MGYGTGSSIHPFEKRFGGIHLGDDLAIDPHKYSNLFGPRAVNDMVVRYPPDVVPDSAVRVKWCVGNNERGAVVKAE